MAYLRKRGNVYYVYWRDGGRGVPLRCQRVGPKKTDALRVKSEIEHRRVAGRFGIILPSKITFTAFAEKWLERRVVKPQTLRRDRSLIRTHLVPAFRAAVVHMITPDDIAGLIADIAKRRSLLTVQRAYAVLHKMFNDAKRWGDATANPVAEVDAPADAKALRRRHPFESVDEFCEAMAAILPAWRPMVFVDLLTGLRWGEITAWRWSDLHLEAGKASVWQNIPVGERAPGSPKGGAQRVVHLFPQVVRALMDLPQRGELVFPAARGGRLNYGWFRRQIWEPAMEQAGLQLTFHDLRHAFASLLLAFGYTVLYVSQQLGHSSAKVTLDTYGHILEEGHRLDLEATLQKLEHASRGATRVLPNLKLEEGTKTETLDRTGAGDRTRTDDLRITSALLYH